MTDSMPDKQKFSDVTIMASVDGENVHVSVNTSTEGGGGMLDLTPLLANLKQMTDEELRARLSAIREERKGARPILKREDTNRAPRAKRAKGDRPLAADLIDV